MSIKSALPKVIITQQPNLTLARDAWFHSRPNETEVDLENVIKLDVPVNEFPRVTAQFYAPILVREIVCSLRDHVVWARTSRVDNLNEWEVHPLALTNSIDRLYMDMNAKRAAGAEQDDYRFNLPLGYMTHFTVDLPLRTWLNLANYFGHLARSSCGDEIIELWAQMHNQMLSRLEPEWLRSIRYKHRELFPKVVPAQSQRVGSMVFATAVVPIALRAQVVRHRMFMITDDLRSFFNARALSLPISTRMNMQVAAPYEVAKAIVSKRQCWIAQSDIWEPLIAMMNIALGGDKVVLPCDDDDSCPFRRDNELRIEGKDPGPSCPRFAHLYGIPLSEADRSRARQYANKRITANFWLNEVKMEEQING